MLEIVLSMSGIGVGVRERPLLCSLLLGCA